MQWNVVAILDLAGGTQALRKAMAKHGQGVPDSAAISMWKARNRLPGAWSAQVLYVLTLLNRAVDLRPLLVDEPEPEPETGTDDDLFAAD